MTALPGGWCDVALGDVIAPISDREVPDPATNIPFIGMEHVEAQSGRVLEYGDASEIKSASPLVEPGDVLYGRLRPYLNKVAIAPEKAYTSGEFIVFRENDVIDGRWLKWRFTARDFVDYAIALNAGDRPRVKWPQMKSFRLQLPPLDEQHRIVELLEDRISRLEAAETGLRQAELRLRALERSALDTCFGVNEDGVQLGEIVKSISAGKSFGTANAPAGNDEWGIIKVSAMTWGEFRPEENKAVSGDRVDPRYEIREGDLLVSRANTSKYVGASVLVGPVRPRLLLSDKSLRVQPRSDISTEWLWRVLQAPSTRSQVSALATGTKDSMRNISQGSILKVWVPDVAPAAQVEALRRFDEITSVSGPTRLAVANAKRRSVALRRSLLNAAFSGRLSAMGVGP